MRTREEHLAWCKARALEYLDQFEIANALTSFMSDMEKHEETKIPTEGALADLTLLALYRAADNDYDFIRRYIEGWR
jgi:hypothetical protein